MNFTAMEAVKEYKKPLNDGGFAAYIDDNPGWAARTNTDSHSC